MKRYGAAGLVMMALALGACGQQGVQPESGQELGIPLAGAGSEEGSGTGSVEGSGAGSLSAAGTAQPSEGSAAADIPGAGNGVAGGSPAGSTSAGPNTGNAAQSGSPAGSTSAGPNTGNAVQSGSPESSISVGALGAGNGTAGGSPADSGLLQPTYIGSWKVTEYCYPSTPCGLSQLEVDVLIGSELVYALESFTCNRKVVESEGFGYEFSFDDSLEEYEKNHSVSVSGWFAGEAAGKVKTGYLTIDEGILGDQFSYMEEQPDKMLICYYGVVFLAVREQTSAALPAESSRDSAYREALNNLLLYNQLPLGQEADIPQTVSFAIQDIDGDGREELLLNYQGSIMAAIQEMVYDYNESKGELYREIWDFPDIKFYGSGYALAEWSHNQTLSEFWPYNLYRYNSGTDQYEPVYAVTAWDKALSETDASGNPFPDAADVSGAGRVYMIEDSATGQISGPMDTADYEKWYSDTLGKYVRDNTVVVWQLLTEENLRNL